MWVGEWVDGFKNGLTMHLHILELWSENIDYVLVNISACMQYIKTVSSVGGRLGGWVGCCVGG